MLTSKTALTTLFVFISVIASSIAQDNQNEYSTIFAEKNDGPIDHGFYGSFGFGYSNIDSKDALLFSMKGAWVINHNFAMGLAGYGFSNQLNKTNAVNDYFLGGGYGGFYFEPILFPESQVHVSFPILIGGGGISTIPSNYINNEFGNSGHGFNDLFYDYDSFFVFEPGIEIEFNMVSFFRFSVGGSYRFTNGVLLNNPGVNQIPVYTLNTFNFYTNFKFGKF